MRRLLPTACLALTLVLSATPTAGADVSAPVAGPRAWTPASQAAIRPGAQLVSETGGCTANFVFTGGSEVYLGSAAHCTATGSSVDGCANPSLAPGALVDVEGAEYPATLAYSSWHAMQVGGEADPDTCRYNDFALLRLDPRDHDRVNPTVPEWGGPLGLSAGARAGDTVYFYGQPDGSRASQARVVSREGGGRTYQVRAGLLGLDAGVPGDLGSGWLDPTGRAFGVLSTIEFAPSPLSNGVADLAMALAYMRQHSDVDAVLAVATEPFAPTGEAPPRASSSSGRVPVTRLAGSDREATAAAVAATWSSADAVVVATGAAPTDALAAGPAAAALDAPLLLAGTSGLSDASRAQVDRLDPDTAYVVGGPQAVPDRVVRQLQERGIAVERVSGADRYATAAAVARRFGTPGTPLVVASGEGFADALAAAPLAAAQDGMLVLTAPGSLPAATRDLLASWDPSAVQVVGGPAVIPDARMDEISREAGRQAGRFAGPDRYATGAVVARALFDADGFVFGGRVWIASGANFPDALAGGPAVDRERGLLLLVPPAGPLPDSVRAVAEDTDGGRVAVLGGTAAVGDDVADAVARTVAD